MGMKLRYRHEADGRGVMILETEPTGRSIFCYRQNAASIWLPFPYMIFIVHYTLSGGKAVYGGIYDKGLIVFLRNTPLETIDDQVYHSPTDMERGGLVCTPHQFDRKTYASAEELVANVVSLWWNTYHNIASTVLTKWQYKNVENVLEMEWPGRAFSLRNAIDKDYLSQFGYGPAGKPLPKEAPLVNEDFLPQKITL